MTDWPSKVLLMLFYHLSSWSAVTLVTMDVEVEYYTTPSNTWKILELLLILDIPTLLVLLVIPVHAKNNEPNTKGTDVKVEAQNFSTQEILSRRALRRTVPLKLNSMSTKTL